MRAFQSRGSAVVGASTGALFKSPNSSPQGTFPSAPVVSTRNYQTNTQYRTRSSFAAASGIHSLVAPASMGLFAQRACMSDSTKAVAGMSGYSDNAYNEESDNFLQAIEEAMSEYEEKDDGVVEDVDFQSSVLNIQTHKGTFILNKQAPKLQLWLSSPISGPTHYDRVKGTAEDPEKIWWKCDRQGHSLEELLGKELGSVVGSDGPVPFSNL